MFYEIPFSVPLQYQAGLLDGSIVRIGALLKDSETGQIIAHVVESSLGQNLLSQVGGFVFSPVTSIVNVVLGVDNAIKIRQLKTMVEQLQLLQFANIGIAMAGIGVSIVGFAVVCSKLKGIEKSLEALSCKLDFYFRDQYDRELRRCFSTMAALLERSDIAWTHIKPKKEYLSVASALADQSGFLHGEIAHCLSLEKFDKELFALLAHSMLFCNASRIEALLLADEMNAAHETARRIGNTYTKIFDPLSPYPLAHKLGEENNSNIIRSSVEFRGHLLDSEELISGVRDVTDAALTKPFLIETLVEQGISGRDFIASLRRETEQPFLLLGCSV